MGKNQYNFLNRTDLPKGDYIQGELSLVRNIKWAKTSDYNDSAKNHCGAVLVTNLARYYEKLGYDDLVKKNLQDTFNSIHQIVGNGPKMFLARKARLYFLQQGYRLQYTSFRSFKEIKKSIAKNSPLGFLLSAGLFEWHWVMVVGWLQFKTGEEYIEVVTGWNSSTTKYYKLGKGSCWLTATSYTIENI